MRSLLRVEKTVTRWRAMHIFAGEVVDIDLFMMVAAKN